MKKIFVLLVLLMLPNLAVAEEEIKLELPAYTEPQCINLTPRNSEALSPINQESGLKNNGLILQNSVPPINGLQYNSTRMMPPARVDEPAVMPMMGMPMLNY